MMPADPPFDLRDALAEAYPDPARARPIATRAGIREDTLPITAPDMSAWWWEALGAAQRQGRLLALVDAAIADPAVAALKPRFEELRGALPHVRKTAFAAGPCPYRGLLYFEEGHADNYFGRQAMVEKLVQKLRRANFVAVVGPSGSGKSSLVRAGLLPALSSGALPGSTGWQVEIFYPGDDPLRSLAAALVARLAPDLSVPRQLTEARDLAEGLRSGALTVTDVLAHLRARSADGARLLLIADQFEEAFTLCQDDGARRAFLDALLAIAETSRAPRVTVLLTLRADFFGRALQTDGLGRLVDEGQVNVLPMSREERREAVEQPALRAGCRFEGGLVERILDAVQDAPGDLPLLEFALTELWARQTADGMLTHAAYESIGEVRGAIARHADDTLAGLDETQVAAVRAIFTRLVQVARPDEAAQDSRRRIGLAELPSGSRELAQRLADARLLVTARDPNSGKETVEVAHEALIRNWGQLQEWLNRDREFLLWRQRVQTWVGIWKESGRNEGALLNEWLLREARMRSEGQEGDLNSDELELLLRSSLAAGFEVAYWRERAPTVIGKVEGELLGGLAMQDPRRAEKAVQSLVGLASPEIVARLAAAVDGDFGDEKRIWVDHEGSERPLCNTILNLRSAAQRRAVLALAKMALPEATATLGRWTPPGMILIPAGPFTMGSTEYSDEWPVHEVWLDAFWIDRYPATNAQWEAFLAARPWTQQELWTEAGWSWRKGEKPEPEGWNERRKKRDHPVRGVCWYESFAYARWTGKVLLSEAQWEKAARGLDGRRYPWSDDFDKEKCNTFESGIGDTMPVGAYSTKGGDSPYGVADMAGNVWEWCLNLYVPYRYNAADGREAPEGTAVRVLRGGSFGSNERGARCACRDSTSPAAAAAPAGFGWVRPLASDLCLL
jgi:formylglycine-generating enzyme required for sulfatase activity/energy-coupling factor transporter ATP-binding protein EcfA2